MKKKLIFIFTLAFLVRLIGLNQSLWLDEATTARVVQEYKLTQIVSRFLLNDFHPPLYYWFMKLWTNFFGYSEISLRMPSVLFSLATGYVIYKMVRWMYGYRAGLFAAVFFLFNPLIVYYSQEARMYMATTFFLTVALYYFEKMLRIQKSKGKSQNVNPNLKSQILFNLFVFLSLMTFYGSIFLITAFLLYFLYKKQFRNFFICLFAVFVYFLAISPLLYQQLINAKISLSNVTNWSLVLGKANIKNLLLIPIKFSIGRIDFYPKWLYYLMAGGWSIFVISQIHISNLNAVNLFIYLFIFPLVLGFAVSFVTPLLQYFRFLYLIPIMCLLLSFSLKDNPMFRKIVLIGFFVFSCLYLTGAKFHREDWKSLAQTLPKDQPVYMIKSSSDPLLYYRKDLKVNELTSLESSTSLPQKIIIIPYSAEIYGYDYKKTLVDYHFHLQEEKSFRELNLEIWVHD
ncbi:hypothetical protein COS31_03815 [Candidatus Roizmanbacteria bacterium CG02_land_8_20_14_3_00_36_15]|uniref:Glycosyltransferase RgtA/B/C/D-like domain-containing protein n=2 Tax=Candidatus Roizmaniibacteriota TaxID=1752723 RepID=A0A2M8KKK0_9BACT|nr:MAG: hypothetical protein COS51_02640 [Candidatus Roizmanbacteria bacterium CG03_land_8_20_14_0_80_36_21]PIV37534.1 MAG: hypothetical protein COS31_03815 [Candidatus Roizmanbacteria bacterium CG02_land_8_20_14_3_00_36_15]PIY70440.1 MAG: hypothetical protein COY89_01365 [Candidatus Roizmanbacteria bacterium CG_4_10_14_0_8_um_filter_36_36]PJA53831.1 MAG: hypothetical protein CO166_00460 [Candidatus Roizmanbacteria bacterium CG_4_9_14_3_um_filter_36_11]PJE60443.1 MAG: hypothetical protein COU86